MYLLVVEDDPAISRFLVKGLREQRCVVDLIENGLDAEGAALAAEYDAIVLDIMLPGMDGLTLCRRLREQQVDTPILVVTARDSVTGRVEGLDVGADDYLAKPFEFAELVARLRAIVRRGRTRHLSAVMTHGGISVDLRDQHVTVDGRPLSLTATEYRLLLHLMRRAGSIVSRAQLAEHAWGSEYDPESNVVDVYVSYLRRKLQHTSADGLIRTIRGMGYMLGTSEPHA
jgi:two-component system OmpR family response regulator